MLSPKRGRGRPPGAVNKNKVIRGSKLNNSVNLFPASEICSIIAQCGKYNVSTFNFGGLSLTFSSESSKRPDKEPGQVQKMGEVVSPQEITFPGEQVLREEARQADLLITDPYQYEREQIDLFLNPVSSRMRSDGQSEDNIRSQ